MKTEDHRGLSGWYSMIALVVFGSAPALAPRFNFGASAAMGAKMALPVKTIK